MFRMGLVGGNQVVLRVIGELNSRSAYTLKEGFFSPHEKMKLFFVYTGFFLQKKHDPPRFGDRITSKI